MIQIFLISTGIYMVIALAVWLITAFPRKTAGVDEQVVVSVVVSIKDEEKNLPGLFTSFEKLDIRGVNCEFILVDDGSEDSSRKIMEYFAQKARFPVKVLSTSSGENPGKGKKTALTKAVNAADGEFVFVTDADCRVPSLWIHKGLQAFTHDTGMVLGYVERTSQRHNGLLRAEGMAGIIFAWALADLGMAAYCSGGNMVFRKSAFLAVGGYSSTPEIASGDDFFLLQKISCSYKVGSMRSPETFVKTEELPGYFTDKNKNRRRFSKNLDMKPGHMILFIFGIFYHLLFPVMLITGHLRIALTVLLLKTVAEWLIFFTGACAMKRGNIVFLYPIFSVYFPLKVIYYSIVGYVKGYRWKSGEQIR